MEKVNDAIDTAASRNGSTIEEDSTIKRKRVPTPGERKKRLRRIILWSVLGIVGVVTICTVAYIGWNYYLSPYLSQKAYYEQGEAALAAKDTEAAILAYAHAGKRDAGVSYLFGISFGGHAPYADSQRIRTELSLEILKDAQPGDHVYWGVYEQDNDFDNGPEPIRWLVLEADGSERLLISELGLDCQPMHDKFEPVVWAASSVNAWLNNTFLRQSFTLEERIKLMPNTIHTQDNDLHGTKGGPDVNSSVYLLSMEEALHYFPTEEERITPSTKYAKAWGANYRERTGWWWLRSPGVDSLHFAMVINNGVIDMEGYSAIMNKDATVRPVIRLDLERTGKVG